MKIIAVRDDRTAENGTNTKLRIISALGRIFDLSGDDIKAELTAKKHYDE